MLSRIGQTIPSLLAHLGAYAQLTANDVAAAFSSCRRMVGASLLLCCLATALLVATSGVLIAAAWLTTYRWPVVAAVILALLVGCIVATRRLRASLLLLSDSFDGLRSELNLDAALLRRRFSTSGSPALVEESTS